jgi:hypothetical protein
MTKINIFQQVQKLIKGSEINAFHKEYTIVLEHGVHIKGFVYKREYTIDKFSYIQDINWKQLSKDVLGFMTECELVNYTTQTHTIQTISDQDAEDLEDAKLTHAEFKKKYYYR